MVNIFHFLLVLTRFTFFLGLGALCSPLVSTQFSRMPDHWSFHYLVSLGISLLNTVLLVAVFKFKTQDGKNVIDSITV